MVDRGLCSTRAQAQALIMGGKVKVRGEALKKPGTLISVEETDIEVSGLQPFVSRGGLKLAKAIPLFGIQVQDRVCMDVGASTGGFTDCLLQSGASQVIAVDVGYGQLDWKLRSDQRVQVLEKTNIRELKAEQLEGRPSLGVVDTSFISLKKVLPPLSDLLCPDAEMVALLKPQFEHKDYIQDSTFKGVVKGLETHRTIVSGVLHDLERLLPQWTLAGLDFSPITGPKGNMEFLLYYTRGCYSDKGSPLRENPSLIEQVIEQSYQTHAS